MNVIYQKEYKNRAFTLVELLLVITIISVLMAVVVPRFVGRSNDARIAAAKQTIIGSFGLAISLFEQDVGRFPNTEEGLTVLLQASQMKNWRGPYIQSATLPPDPWGYEYRYSYPSTLTSSEYMYDIVSPGPDGVYGNEDDVTNHNDQILEMR
jgi:general secretion pathway protein G